MFGIKKHHTETAHTVVRLSDTLRQLLKHMNFPTIPEEATHIAFFPDGESCFLDELELKGGTFSDRLGTLMFVSTSIHHDIPVKIED